MTTTDLKSGVVGELGAKSPVLVATMTNITLSGEQTVNGVAVVEDDVVLVNGQTDATENGVYAVSTSSWTRAVWFNNELNAVSGTLILTTLGTLWANTLWEVICADTPIVFGTSEITFTQFQKAGAGALVASNNLSDLTNAATARTNLGVAIGTNVQAYDATLTALAAYNTNGIITQIDADTFVGRTLTQGSAISVTNGSGVSGNPTVAVNITGLTADATPDPSADYVMTYDASATANKKVLLSNAFPIQFVSSQTISSVATVSFNLTAGFTRHIFKFVNVLPATSGKGLMCQVSLNGGSTYEATNYFGNTEASNTTDNIGSATNATTRFTLSGKYDTDANWGIINTSSKGLSGSMEIFNPDDTSHNKIMKSNVSYTTLLGYFAQSRGSSIYNGSTGAINNLKFYFDSGNLASGTILYFVEK
jgi:hypothetical protein